ncbi:MAG: hypothetical protein COT84_00960 [Chlamydiae bacterium CG10_big_fil_rev_8_21_14_0_10_35_9]|nr:MAG: hypothetical protein COT84_00960 [Chlamydiae bacterium CG10_big_fil_rev_8_21_14_0_10_35_9]
MLWLTDVHIDYKKDTSVNDFFERIQTQDEGGICITGDIAENRGAIEFIQKLSSKVRCPIYFVLGNHDFYGSEIFSLQEELFELFKENTSVYYLAKENVLSVSPDTAVIGVDNWYDLKGGDYFTSDIKLKDFKMIDNFKSLSKQDLYDFMGEHSQKIIKQVEEKLDLAFQGHTHAILLTHVPCFREACLHNNQIADDKWAPFFTHRQLADFIVTYMSERVDKSLTILSGHTHHKAEYSPLQNVVIKVGCCPDDIIEWQKLSF